MYKIENQLKFEDFIFLYGKLNKNSDSKPPNKGTVIIDATFILRIASNYKIYRLYAH